MLNLGQAGFGGNCHFGKNDILVHCDFTIFWDFKKLGFWESGICGKCDFGKV